MAVSRKESKEIAVFLEQLYPETPIPLDHKDPYTLLISVLLSAQCTDERVNKVTPFYLQWQIIPWICQKFP